ncbi:unannotated protein [freshwater metagenome]|uniref:Unannotated protein n=1 Tax=freshwater metagenome TaxID=449393 RepID=A0A6J7SP79_9ZZZZ
MLPMVWFAWTALITNEYVPWVVSASCVKGRVKVNPDWDPGAISVLRSMVVSTRLEEAGP